MSFFIFWWRLETIGAPLCTAVFHLRTKTEGRATPACVQRQQKWYATCLEFTEKHVMSHLFNLERCKTCYRWQAEVLTGTAIFPSKSWQGGDSGQFPSIVKYLISLFEYWWTTCPASWSKHTGEITASKDRCGPASEPMFQHEQNFIIDLDRITISWSFKYVFIHILKRINHSSIWYEFRVVLCDISNKRKSPSVQDTNS